MNDDYLNDQNGTSKFHAQTNNRIMSKKPPAGI